MTQSIRGRIILAFGLIIISVIGASALVANWSAEHQLKNFVSEISGRQSYSVAAIVETTFNIDGNLDSIFDVVREEKLAALRKEPRLPDFDTNRWLDIVDQSGNDPVRSVSAILEDEKLRMGDSVSLSGLVQRWHEAQTFVFDRSIADDSGNVEWPARLSEIKFSIRRGETGGEHATRDGEHDSDLDEREEHSYSIPFYEWASGDVAGNIVIEDHEEFGEESSRFAEGTLTTLLLGGLITAIFAFGISIWLASRINSPVRELTRAALRIAESGTSEQIEVRSEAELGQMSMAFNQMTDALEAQRLVRQQLIADISHELYTPLSIIQLEMKGMVDGMQEPSEAAARVQREIELLSGLINDLELIAETENNAIQIRREPVEAGEFLAEVIERWQSKANAEDVVLELMTDAEPGVYSLDRNRMRQVLDNLLRNALQHSEPGGRITVSAEKSDSEMVFAVADNGHGIGHEHLSRIFERFYRIEENEKSLTGGRGLGLAIVEHIVGLHGGRVEVESKLGVGSTFRVLIPEMA